ECNDGLRALQSVSHRQNAQKVCNLLPHAEPFGAPAARRRHGVHQDGGSVDQRAQRMTYCIGVMLDKGMIFASDSRTNAGMDNIAKFCKMTVFERPGDRVIVLLSSGNLAGTQAVIGVLNQRCGDGGADLNLWTARTMFDVAMLVADAMRDIERRDGEYLQENEIGFNRASIL